MSVDRRTLLQQTAAALALTGVAPARAFAAGSGEESAAARLAERLALIARRDPVIQAIAWLNPEAQAAALAADQRLAAGAAPRPLEGLTVLAKSTFDVAGSVTDGSNAEWRRLMTEPARADAITVTRLQAAGAILLGKGAADDFAAGGDGTASATGQVYNPRYPDRQRISGGSSGGGAAAVAAGFCDAAIGTDDGGSNRIPAHYCGVVGVKTSFGLVPRTGVIPTYPWIDCHGPIAASAAVAARVLRAIAGPDPSDPLSRAGPQAEPPAMTADALRGIKLGLVRSHVAAELMSPRQAQALGQALMLLRAGGATIVSVEPPINRANMYERLKAPGADPWADAAMANALVRYLDRLPGGAARWLATALPAYRTYYPDLPEAPGAILTLAQTPFADVPGGLAYARQRDLLVEELGRYCAARGLDALIWPTLTHDALTPGAPWPKRQTPLNLANGLGLPEVSTPIGLDTVGTPLGNLSFLGLPFRDFQLLAFAHAFEQQRGVIASSAR